MCMSEIESSTSPILMSDSGKSRPCVKGTPLTVGAGSSDRASPNTTPCRASTTRCSTAACSTGRRISQWAPLPTRARSASTLSCSRRPSGYLRIMTSEDATSYLVREQGLDLEEEWAHDEQHYRGED